jgi:hypothetical protein
LGFFFPTAESSHIPVVDKQRGQLGTLRCNISFNPLDCAYFCADNGAMEIVWRLDKAAANPKRHDGVTFEEAKQVLFDPFALTYEDHDALNEQRFVTLGMGAKVASWW